MVKSKTVVAATESTCCLERHYMVSKLRNITFPLRVRCVYVAFE